MSGGHGKAYLRPALGLLAVLATYGLLQAPSGQGWTAGSARLRLQTCSRVPQLRGYFASTWESQFAAQVASAPACELGDKPERVGAWLAGAQAASGSGSGLAPRSQDVFSRFEWTDECSGDTIVQHIEPLVGHFRHPLAPHCNKNKTSTVDIQSRDYILFSGLAPDQFKRIYPGRRLLLDCGTATFKTGLAYLLSRYRQEAVEFDEIWAWEYVKQDPVAYWGEVPSDVKPRLHFYNTGITADTSSPDHPIAFIKKVVQPGDFLALKLDIDNSPVELAFMAEVGRDPELRALIGELFFEQHYTHKAMAPWFKESGGNVTHADVLQHFTKLRQMGVRLHYWP